MSYLYASNIDSLDRRDQLEIQLDSGDTAILRRGHFYDLSAGELARAQRYAVFTFSATLPDEDPIGVRYMPVKGNPANGQVPSWSSSEAAFVPNELITASDNGQPGIVAPTSLGWVFNTLVLVANTAYVTRFRTSLPRALTLIELATSTAASADDAVDVGIYSAAGVRLASSGPTTGKLNGTGLKTIALALALLQSTVYYAAVSSGAQGGTAASLRVANFASATMTQMFGTSMPKVEGGSYAASHPLPPTLGITPAAMSNPPVIILRES